MTIKERFDQFDTEFLKFNRIENPRHERADLCAFLMLHDFVPGFADMIFLSTKPEDLVDVSDSFIRDLVRCGVIYSSEYDSLIMYV